MSNIENLASAQSHMEDAKRRFTEAARAAMRGDPAAPALARAAYDEVNAARAELRAIGKQTNAEGKRP